MALLAVGEEARHRQVVPHYPKHLVDHGSIDRPVYKVVEQLRPGVHLDHVNLQIGVEQQIEPQELVAIVPRSYARSETVQILYRVVS